MFFELLQTLSVIGFGFGVMMIYRAAMDCEPFLYECGFISKEECVKRQLKRVYNGIHEEVAKGKITYKHPYTLLEDTQFVLKQDGFDIDSWSDSKVSCVSWRTDTYSHKLYNKAYDNLQKLEEEAKKKAETFLKEIKHEMD